KEIDVVPKEVEQDGMTIGQIGVLFQQEYEKSFFKSLTYGFTQTLEKTQSIVRNSVMLITGQLSVEMLSGPVINISKSLTIDRSEEHTSELQSRFDIVCRL